MGLHTAHQGRSHQHRPAAEQVGPRAQDEGAGDGHFWIKHLTRGVQAAEQVHTLGNRRQELLRGAGRLGVM